MGLDKNTFKERKIEGIILSIGLFSIVCGHSMKATYHPRRRLSSELALAATWVLDFSLQSSEK